MSRAPALLLVFATVSWAGGCETVEQVAGCCIALPFAVAGTAGCVTGCCTRVMQDGSSASAALVGVASDERVVRLPRGGGAVAY